MATRITRVVLALSLMGGSARACSVCYGDPESEMVQGALMGVYVMVGVISCMLACIAGTGLVWLRRSRRLDAQ